MKTPLTLLAANICAAICFSVAGFLAYKEVTGWGWFLITGLKS